MRKYSTEISVENDTSVEKKNPEFEEERNLSFQGQAELEIEAGIYLSFSNPPVFSYIRPVSLIEA